MRTAARSHLSTGVALLGAGAIAISPLAPPVPDVKVPTLSTIGVELNAAVNPLQTWIDVFGTAAENLAILGQRVAENPAPILQQVIQNQLANIETLAPVLQDFAEGFVEALNPFNPAGIPAGVQAALEQIVTGHPAEGFPALFQAFLTPILFPALGVLGAVQGIITQSAQNMLDVANLAVTAFATVALGALSPLASGFSGLGAATQAIVDAASEGDILGVVAAVLDVPGVVTGAVLNGFGFDGGFLTADFGTLNGLINLRQMFADALKPDPPAAGLLAATSSGTSGEADTTVTFDITDGGASLTPTAFRTAATGADESNATAPEPDGAPTVAEEVAGDDAPTEAPDEEVAQDEPTDETVTEENVTEENVTEENVTEEDSTEENSTGEEATEQEPADEGPAADQPDNAGGGESGDDTATGPDA